MQVTDNQKDMSLATMLKSNSFFSKVPAIRPDAIFALTAEYHKDQNPKKVNLGQGTYRDESGEPFVLESVRKARQALCGSDLKHEYLPILGLAEFCAAAAELALGADIYSKKKQKIATCQSLSGTGALHLAGRFLRDYTETTRDVYVSDPTWSNHHGVFNTLGFKSHTWRYNHPVRNGLDFDEYCAMLNKAAPGSIIILHACAHNPTGYDPTREQWATIGKLMKERGLFPIFDSAYLGFNSGNVNDDAWAIRHLVGELDMEAAICLSFAKNMGLYGERVGCIAVVSNDETSAANTQSVLANIQRTEISNPPVFGARVASAVLNDQELRKTWEGDLVVMSTRIRQMRQALYDALVQCGAPGDWSHISAQSGMFGLLNLKPEIVHKLKDQYHIYMAENSRISIAGLNPSNVEYVAASIATCLKDA